MKSLIGLITCTSICVLSNAQSVLLAPTGNQTITQPSGTNLNVTTSGGGALEWNATPVWANGTAQIINAALYPYNADPTCTTDSTAAINNALAAAAGSPAAFVYLPPGSYCHNNLIQVAGVRMVGAGYLTELRSTDTIYDDHLIPQLAVVLSGTGPELSYMRITTTFTTPRQNNSPAFAVLASNAINYTVDHLYIIGSGGAGFAAYSSTRGTETNNFIKGTLADGMIHAASSAFIHNSNNTTVDTGDDGFSVDSIATDTTPTHDIQFVNDKAYNPAPAGRGFEVDGGYNIQFDNMEVHQATYACFSVTSGSSFGSTDAYNITISNVVASDCQGGLIAGPAVSTSSYKTSRVKVSNIVITGSTSNGIQIGAGVANTTFDVEIANGYFTTTNVTSGYGGYGADVTGAANVNIHDSTFFNFGYYCLNAGTSSGTFNFSNNLCNGNNTSNTANQAFALANTGFSNISLLNNAVRNGTYSTHNLAIFGGSGDGVVATLIGNTGDVSGINSPPPLMTLLSGDTSGNLNLQAPGTVVVPSPIVLGGYAYLQGGVTISGAGVSFISTATAASGTNYASQPSVYQSSIWNGSSATACSMFWSNTPATGTNAPSWLTLASADCPNTAGISAPSYMESLYTPASSSATCSAGQFADDVNYHYVCTATNTWKRVALSPF